MTEFADTQSPDSLDSLESILNLGAPQTPVPPESLLIPASKPNAARYRNSAIPTRPLRVLAQPGFVLHSYPYKETSLIVDVFTRQYGRIALLAKGAKRPHSQLRGALQTFQPLTLSWTGKSDLQTLTAAEWVGGMLPLEKSALLCGFYLNEIIVKLLQRDDPQPLLFDAYVATINQLAHGEPATIVLRKFELNLLKSAGVVGDLTFCTQQRTKVDADVIYVVDPDIGARPSLETEQGVKVHGKTLLDMHSADYSDARTQSQSKLLMRFLLAHHLHGATINTRQILMDLQKL